MHAPIELIGIVGRSTFDAGRAYARQGRVTVTTHDPAEGVATGRCLGSGDRVYATQVLYERTRHGVVSDLRGLCSCPVAVDCKHAVALLIDALSDPLGERPGARGTAVPEWERSLLTIFGPQDEGITLALVVEHQSASSPLAAGARGAQAHARRRHGTPGITHVRPMRPGKRGGWIATGASWSDLQRGYAPGIDPAQADALVALIPLHAAAHPYAYGVPTWIPLDEIASPALWPALEEIAAAGVHLMEPSGAPVALRRSPAHAEILVTAAPDGALRVGADVTDGGGAARDGAPGVDSATPGAPGDGAADPGGAPSHDSTDAATGATSAEIHAGPLGLREVVYLGDPPHGLVGRSSEGLLLVPFDRTARREWVDLQRAGTAVIPAADRPRFEREVLPRITRRAGWRSPDSSFIPPPPPTPVLTLAVRLSAGEEGPGGYVPTASLDWEWRYREAVATADGGTAGGDGTADADGTADDSGPAAATGPADTTSAREVPERDVAAERAITARVAAILAPLPALLDGPVPAEHATLRGNDVVHLAHDVLPALQALDGVEVTHLGPVPEFRDAGAPRVEVALGESHRDWFDLEVSLTVAGHAVPIGQVIRALTLGDKRLFLPDGSYVGLDLPELERLRDLLAEGQALTDHRRKGLRVSRLQVSWWEELLGLGIVAEQEGTWLAAVRAAGAALTDAPPPPVPPGLGATLRPYQRDGFAWLARRRRAGLGGVLADDMGLGKTVQTLAMILDARTEPDGAAGDGGAPHGARPDTTAGDPASGPWLVVAPTSVVPSWAAEAARFAPELSVAVVTGTQARRSQTLVELAAGTDVVVTSYALFRLEYEQYEEIAPAGLVLDEAQYVKNHQSQAFSSAKRLPAPVKFAITGTPMENNLGELWSMFAIVAPGLLGSPAQFRDAYRSPIERGHGAKRLPRLRRRISPFILRRTKDEVATDLPAKQEQVLGVDLAPAHQRIYARHLQRERQRVLGLVDDLEHNRVEVLSALTRLRQLAIDASLVDPAYSGTPSSKLDVLLPLLTEAAAEGHRVLVFSQFTRYLALIAERLRAAGLDYSYLDGATRQRGRVIESFATGQQPVFLISLKAGGTGLNLAMADYCVLADPWWNPATEAQAVDRAHRIGQTRPVMVYRLVATGTIEEKVMALQESKRALVADVLGRGAEDGGVGPTGTISAAEIRSLLS